MTDALSDFSKIAELQEIKRLYEESEERHSQELQERDAEMARLHSEAQQQAPHQGAENGQLDELRAENERLNKQVQLLRQEYGAKIERLNTRIRELSGNVAPVAAAPDTERKGFFRR